VLIKRERRFIFGFRRDSDHHRKVGNGWSPVGLLGAQKPQVFECCLAASKQATPPQSQHMDALVLLVPSYHNHHRSWAHALPPVHHQTHNTHRRECRRSSERASSFAKTCSPSLCLARLVDRHLTTYRRSRPATASGASSLSP